MHMYMRVLTHSLTYLLRPTHPHTQTFCDNMGLQARGARGEHSPPGPNGEFDISNKGRVGKSEVQLVQQMIDGVDLLIKMEEEC